MENKCIEKIIPLFGVVSVIFYFSHVFFGALFYENYDPMSQAISDLTASDSPSRNIAIVFSMLYGIFTVIFTSYFFLYFRQKINKPVTFGAGFFCIMTIISFLGYTLFPLSESGYAGAFQDKMHIVVTIAVVLLTIIALILFMIGFFRTKKLKCLGIISLCTFLLLFIGSVLMKNLPKEYFGIAERINVYSIVVFIGILSLWMHKYIKNVVRTNGI